MHFYKFFSSIFIPWIRIRILNADPDPGGKINKDLVHTIPNPHHTKPTPFQNECTPQKPFVQIILAAKWLVWHSSTTTSDDLCLLFCLHPSSSMTSSNQKKEKKFRLILSDNRQKILSQEKIRKVCRTCYHKKYADRF